MKSTIIIINKFTKIKNGYSQGRYDPLSVFKLQSWEKEVCRCTSPRKRIEKYIFALVLTYADFYEEFEKKYERILEIIFTLPPRP